MFEQESYNNATQVESQDSDLFRNYEIRNWNYSSTLYKILAISAVLNIAVLAFIGQTNLLTLRGCDSPFVGRVCQVLDMAYVGTVLFGTEREYVDMEYEKTDLGDAEITYIDVSGETPPLTYPEGYFELANPVQYAMLQQQGENTINLTNSTPGINIPGFSTPRNNDSDLLNQRATLPPSNPNPFQDDATATFKAGGDDANPRIRKKPRNRPISSDKMDSDEKVAENNPDSQPTPKVDPTSPVNDAEINKRPFKDLGNMVNDQIAKNSVKLDSQFILNAKGKLTKDGKLDPKTFAFGEATGSPEMIEIGKVSVEAINNSGYLQYLSSLSGKDLNLEIKQDDVNLSAVIQSEVESETRAKTLSSLLHSLIEYKKSQKLKPDADQNDKDDLALLEGITVEYIGKRLVITFGIPKAVAHPMIQRKLQEQAAELKKENGTAELKPDGNTAKK